MIRRGGGAPPSPEGPGSMPTSCSVSSNLMVWAPCDGGRPQWQADALIDPWCTLEIAAGKHVLYGYAIHHSFTGDLSWVASTAIHWIASDARRAVTVSGRRYELGRRIKPVDIPSEGEEAWLAYDILLGDHVVDRDAVPRLSVDRESDSAWLTACKIARHLYVATPGRALLAVDSFLKNHEKKYRLKRSWSQSL